jgi:hypothetical protein
MGGEEEKRFWGELEVDIEGIGGREHKSDPKKASIERLVTQIENLIRDEPDLMKSLSLIIYKVGMLTTENQTLRHINKRIKDLIESTEEKD